MIMHMHFSKNCFEGFDAEKSFKQFVFVMRKAKLMGSDQKLVLCAVAYIATHPDVAQDIHDELDDSWFGNKVVEV